MTQEQVRGLKHSIEKFGKIYPVVIDQNNMIIDGYHRNTVYRDLEGPHAMTPIIRMHVDDKSDIKKLRQILNQVKGENDPDRYAEELRYILDNQGSEGIEELADILARDSRELTALIENSINDDTQLMNDEGDNNPDRLTDKEMIKHHQDTFLHGNIKQITLYFNNEEYQKVVPRIQKSMEILEVQNNTDLFIKLLDVFEGN